MTFRAVQSLSLCMSLSLRLTSANMQLHVEDLCKPVQGDFLKMPFPDNTFDGAYAIEATCHAPIVSSPLMYFANHHTGSA